MQRFDVVIVGGGIMGLLGAYEMANAGLLVAVVEKRMVGNSQAGSSGLTRSLRTDYEDPVYAKLAAVSWEKWQQLQSELGVKLVQKTACLNLGCATGGGETYVQSAAKWLARDKRAMTQLTTRQAVEQRFEQFKCFTFAVLEGEAGIGFPKATLRTLKKALNQRIVLLENTEIISVELTTKGIVARTSAGRLQAAKLVIAAGLGTPGVLARIKDLHFRLTLTAACPAECVYYVPKRQKGYTARELPVFACLDKGIYGHPIVAGLTRGVKIGRYAPPASVNKDFCNSNQTIEAFISTYMPDLASQSKIIPITDTDQCAYDMTPDEGFVLGPLKSAPNIFVAAGFCGTGYKFAPVVAELLCDFAQEKRPRYNVEVFNPERFNV